VVWGVGVENLKMAGKRGFGCQAPNEDDSGDLVREEDRDQDGRMETR